MVKLTILVLPTVFLFRESVAKVIYDHTIGILIVPSWPNQIWHVTLKELAPNPVLIIASFANHLYLPNHSGITQSFFRDLELLNNHSDIRKCFFRDLELLDMLKIPKMK